MSSRDILKRVSIAIVSAFLLYYAVITLSMGSSQGSTAKSDSGLLEAVRSFDTNRIQVLVKLPESKTYLAETDNEGNGALHLIAKVGHYKYPPAGIPKLLIESGIDVNAKNSNGATALEISLLTGWQKVRVESLFRSLSKLLSPCRTFMPTLQYKLMFSYLIFDLLF